jgi:hypothetical protein
MALEVVVRSRRTELAPPPVEPVPEQPVFAYAGVHRRRLLRAGGFTLAAGVTVWLVAMVAGVMGLGTLPGVPDIAAQDDQRSHATPVAKSAQTSEGRRQPARTPGIGSTPTQRREALRRPSGARATERRAAPISRRAEPRRARPKAKARKPQPGTRTRARAPRPRAAPPARERRPHPARPQQVKPPKEQRAVTRPAAGQPAPTAKAPRTPKGRQPKP